MTIVETQVLPPEIKQLFNKFLLCGYLYFIYEKIPEYKLMAAAKYSVGCNKRKKCMEIIKIIEGIHEWKKTSEEKKKKEIIQGLIREHAESSGRVGNIIKKLSSLI